MIQEVQNKSVGGFKIMANRFTQKAQDALNRAMTWASELGHTYIGSEHILLSLLSDEECVASKMLVARGAGISTVQTAVSEISGIGSRTIVTPGDMTPRAKRIIEMSAENSSQYSQSYIGTEHLLLAVLRDKQCMATKILESLGVSVRELEDDIISFLSSGIGGKHEQQRTSDKVSKDEKNGTHGTHGKKSNPPNLSKYGRDLTELGRSGKIDPIIGRETETERVIQVLSRRTKNNPCLIGEPGVGKTAVAEGLAQQIADGTVCDSLKDKTIIMLDIPSMIAGAKYRGEFEERLKSIMEEAVADPGIILFIDEIHTIIGAGAAEGAVDAANIIKPALARGELQVIGATTISEYRKHIEKDAALERRFQPVLVGEPSPEQTVEILKGLRDKYEAHHRLKITDDAIEAAVTLSVRYIPDRYLPDKAIDLVDEAASKLRISMRSAPPELAETESRINQAERDKEEAISAQNFEDAAKYRDEERKLRFKYDDMKAKWEMSRDNGDISVKKEDIAEVVTQWTGIPVSGLLKDENERLKGLEKLLHKYVIGQDRAINAVANTIRRGRIGLRNPDRPIGSFIFLGPTGVGKTELSRALCRILFGNENAMIRLDMSEYMEKHSVSKLIGSPPGYVGFEEGGYLTEKVRRSPYSVILFDEIEKAHPDVFNLFLQILDDGVLTDSQGRTVSFKNSVIIMTSNIGAPSATASKSVGFGSSSFNEKEDTEAQNKRMLDALKSTFKPEFINRIDEIIIFEPLKKESIIQIARIMLDEVNRRTEKIGITLSIDDSAAELIAAEGFDVNYGARPLRRAIVHLIENPLSAYILDGKIKAGDFIKVSADGNIAVFLKKCVDNGAETDEESPEGSESPERFEPID